MRSSRCLPRWRDDGGKSHAQDGTARISAPVSIVKTLRDYSGISLGLKTLRSPITRGCSLIRQRWVRRADHPFLAQSDPDAIDDLRCGICRVRCYVAIYRGSCSGMMTVARSCLLGWGRVRVLPAATARAAMAAAEPV